MKDTAEQDEKYYNDIVKYLNSNFNVDNLKLGENDFYNFIYSPLVLKKISADKTLRNMLLQKKWSNHWYTRTMNEALKESNKLKQLIEIEIN